ncbi:MAG: hypothetical protein WA865_23180 [Spirulinaceae cyanobacterium]
MKEGNAEKMNLKEVHRLLGWQKHSTMGKYEDILSLEPLTEFEQGELTQIARDFERYLNADKVSEGLIKALTTFPLLRLAGFYRVPVELKLEEAIACIEVEDEETIITGRFDILAINPNQIPDEQVFWMLIIEAKNSSIELRAGLSQLLVYTYSSLKFQSETWGMLTNGINYQFVHCQSGTYPLYQLFPPLHLFEGDRAVQILQSLKAICQLQKPLTNAILAS